MSHSAGSRSPLARAIGLAARAGGGLLLTLGGCARERTAQSALAPSGPAAERILELHWILLAISTFVVLLVTATLAYALLRRREFRGRRPPLPISPDTERARREAERQGGEGTVQELEGPRTYIAAQWGRAVDDPELEVDLETEDSDRRSLRWVLVGGVGFPLLVLVGLFVLTMQALGFLTQATPGAMTVEVVGWQFWWEVQYFAPDGRYLFETANEIHIPVDRQVRIRLRSADVIHSFWVPRLHGKLDLIPGRTNEYWIEADEPGIYRGQCAEYCGLQHARMALLVLAQPEEDFERWLAEQALDAVAPEDALARAGRTVFLTHACVACHAIRGTTAVGEIGPDLTHLASRRTLAAATIPNNKGHLGGWIGNPQEIKPGNNMPAVPLDNDEFVALLHYLTSLR